MTMTIVAGLLVSPEHRMQEKGVVGTFLTMILYCLPLTRGKTGHAVFDGRSVKANVLMITHLIIIHLSRNVTSNAKATPAKLAKD